MIMVLIGTAVFVAGMVIICKFHNPFGVFVALFSIFIYMSGFGNISGYEEPVLQEQYELGVVIEPDIYVVQDSYGAVTCEHEIKSEYPEAVKSYGKYTYGTNVEIVFTKKGTRPIMKKYISKAKKTIWTFAIESDEIEYVFYVPEENVEKWQNVHVN